MSLNSKNLTELKALAKDLGVKGYYKMNKTPLIDAIVLAQKGQGSSSGPGMTSKPTSSSSSSSSSKATTPRKVTPSKPIIDVEEIESESDDEQEQDEREVLLDKIRNKLIGMKGKKPSEKLAAIHKIEDKAISRLSGSNKKFVELLRQLLGLKHLSLYLNELTENEDVDPHKLLLEYIEKDDTLSSKYRELFNEEVRLSKGKEEVIEKVKIEEPKGKEEDIEKVSIPDKDLTEGLLREKNASELQTIAREKGLKNVSSISKEMLITIILSKIQNKTPVYTPEFLQDRNHHDLKYIAGEIGLTNYTNMENEELLEKIIEKQGGKPLTKAAKIVKKGYADMKVDELKNILRERKLTGWSRLNKKELVAFLEKDDLKRGLDSSEVASKHSSKTASKAVSKTTSKIASPIEKEPGEETKVDLVLVAEKLNKTLYTREELKGLTERKLKDILKQNDIEGIPTNRKKDQLIDIILSKKCGKSLGEVCNEKEICDVRYGTGFCVSEPQGKRGFDIEEIEGRKYLDKKDRLREVSSVLKQTKVETKVTSLLPKVLEEKEAPLLPKEPEEKVVIEVGNKEIIVPESKAEEIAQILEANEAEEVSEEEPVSPIQDSKSLEEPKGKEEAIEEVHNEDNELEELEKELEKGLEEELVSPGEDDEVEESNEEVEDNGEVEEDEVNGNEEHNLEALIKDMDNAFDYEDTSIEELTNEQLRRKICLSLLG